MAVSELQFGRLIPAMVTPFTDDLEIDFPRVRELANRLIEGGADSLLVNATTGEAPTIFYPQKIELFKCVIDEVAGRVPVIAYSGDNCTQDSVDFSKQVEALGVDGLLLVVPYYNKPPQEGMYRHFKAIAEAVSIPCMLYNIPGRCAVNMTAETTLRLAHDVPNIVGIKEASGDMAQVKAIIDGAPEGFHVYSGDDSTTLDIMKLGGVGVISTIGNVCPDRMKEIINLFVEGEDGWPQIYGLQHFAVEGNLAVFCEVLSLYVILVADFDDVFDFDIPDTHFEFGRFERFLAAVYIVFTIEDIV
jgi:4-hydroxy-tetrahydrodipicolinate synthase